MSGTISATVATTPSSFKAKSYSSVRSNGVGSRSLQVLRASPKDDVDTSTSVNMPIDGESPDIFGEIQDLLKVVDDSDVVEFEMKSDSFNLCLKKYEEPESPVAYYQPPATQAAPPLTAAPAAPVMVNPTPSTVQNGSAAVKPGAEAPAKSAAPAKSSSGVTMLSPMAGTFYRCPGPNDSEFVNVGDSVTVGQTVCIIEAMKLMNEIEAESSGKILEILVDDSSAVDIGTPLFKIG